MSKIKKIFSLVFASIFLSPFIFVTSIYASTVVVNPSNLNGWSILNFDASTNTDIGSATTVSGTLGNFVTGPATPPAGIGSFNQHIGTNGDDADRAVTSAYNGLSLSALTGISYSTFVSAFGSGGQASYLEIRISRNGSGVTDDALFFEPIYQNGTYGLLGYSSAVPNQCGGNPACVSLNTWQTWNASIGGWWSNVDSAGGPPLTTLASYTAQYPNAKVATDSAAFRVQTGFGGSAWANFNGNFDKLSINGTTYDFETSPQSPATEKDCREGGWKTFTNPSFESLDKCIDYINRHEGHTRGDVKYSAYSLNREADFNVSQENLLNFASHGNFAYSDANHDSYKVDVKYLHVFADKAYFAGQVVSATNPAWVGNWLLVEVQDLDHANSLIWGSFTDMATAINGVTNGTSPADGPFTVTNGKINVNK